MRTHQSRAERHLSLLAAGGRCCHVQPETETEAEAEAEAGPETQTQTQTQTETETETGFAAVGHSERSTCFGAGGGPTQRRLREQTRRRVVWGAAPGVPGARRPRFQWLLRHWRLLSSVPWWAGHAGMRMGRQRGTKRAWGEAMLGCTHLVAGAGRCHYHHYQPWCGHHFRCRHQPRFHDCRGYRL